MISENMAKILRNRNYINIPSYLWAFMERSVMTNQKWKDYENDQKQKHFLRRWKTKKQREKEEFQEWLSTDISCDGEDPIYIHVLFYNDEEISMMADGNNKLVNKKRLRDMVASMLYKESKYGKWIWWRNYDTRRIFKI